MSADPDPGALAAVTAACAYVLSAERVAAADSFFILGGTSLNAVELTEELLMRHGLELPLEAVFACETIRDLALCCKPAGGQRGPAAG